MTAVRAPGNNNSLEACNEQRRLQCKGRYNGGGRGLLPAELLMPFLRRSPAVSDHRHRTSAAQTGDHSVRRRDSLFHCSLSERSPS